MNHKHQELMKSALTMNAFAARCPCLRAPPDDVIKLDFRHDSLDHVPSVVFQHERTLQELRLDANQIRELPRELFYCHDLRKLCLSDNELISIPPAIASLIHLEDLDVSKNGIVDLPDNIKGCKHLRTVEASVNPLGKLPEGFTQLLTLTELYLNDTFLDYLPGSFGRLTNLRILELRENHLKTLPRSMTRLNLLERLDLGNNEFTTLPEVVGALSCLLELWCDQNQIEQLPGEIGGLKHLMYIDASRNVLEWLAPEIEGCVSLADLHLSNNQLQFLPESIGRLSNLTTLKVDDNRLTSLPFSIGGLVSLSELNVSGNELEEIPPSIGLLRHLRTLYADENYLYDIPPELGSCSGITVLSLRSNNLAYIPDELGRIPHLRVLNLADNKLRCLPFTLTRLKQLQALWLAENQTKPLVRLQTDIDTETGQRSLTCYLLPQQQARAGESDDMYSDADSFHPSLWEEERKNKQMIHFDSESATDQQGSLQRCPTPYPKEMKHRSNQMRNLAVRQLQLPNGAVLKPADEQAVLDWHGDPPFISGGESVDAMTSRFINGEMVTVLPELKRPSLPLTLERHYLLRADKEKNYRDKARMQQSKQRAEDVATETSSTPSRPARAHGEDEDDGGFLGNHSRSNVNQAPNDVIRTPQLTSYEAFARNCLSDATSVRSAPAQRTRAGPGSARGYESDTEGHHSRRRHRPQSGVCYTHHEQRNSSYHRDGYTSDGDVTRPRPQSGVVPRASPRDQQQRVQPGANSSSPRTEPTHNDLGNDLRLREQPRVPPPPRTTSLSGNSFPVYGDIDSKWAATEKQNGGIPPAQPQQANDTSAEDESYRQQLYKASVKLQKTPSDRRARLQDGTDRSGRSAEKRPPPYPALPPYMPPRSQEVPPMTVAHATITQSRSNMALTTEQYRPTCIELDNRSPTKSSSHDVINKGSTTQYDEDVALYKTVEPNSHVSSSTDSGYGHHIYERVENRLTDAELAQGQTRVPPPPPPPGTSSECHTPPYEPTQSQPTMFEVVLTKNPGLGFSIAGGVGSPGNPFRQHDQGIFVTKVQPGGPASDAVQPGDKILQVDDMDFRLIQHNAAVNFLKQSGPTVRLQIERF